MKYHNSLLIGFLLSLSFLSSCDKIEIGQFVTENNIIHDECELSDFTARTNPVRKVLLEDFTGHQCGTCPYAAVKIKELTDTYGDQIVAVAIHAGGLAELLNEDKFNYDFTTTAGNDYDALFGIDIIPNGMINRQNYPERTHMVSPFKWDPYVSAMTKLAPEADIQINAFYNETIDQLCIDTYYEFLEEMPGNYRLSVLIVENDIVSWQKNYENGDPNYPVGDLENYTHQHVLRAAVNGSWGKDLQETRKGNPTVIRYGYELGSDWVKENLELIAFIYNADNYEVLQAEKVHLEQ